MCQDARGACSRMWCVLAKEAGGLDQLSSPIMPPAWRKSPGQATDGNVKAFLDRTCSVGRTPLVDVRQNE